MKKKLLLLTLILALVLSGCVITKAPDSDEDLLATDGNQETEELPTYTVVQDGCNLYLQQEDGTLLTPSVQSLIQVTVQELTVGGYSFTLYTAGDESWISTAGHYDYEIEPVCGSDRYFDLGYGDQSQAYSQLLDLDTMTLLDPLALLEIPGVISDVKFSPQGDQAVLMCNKSQELYLANLETNTLKSLSVPEGYSVWAEFIDEDTLWINAADDSLHNSFYCYTLSTGDWIRLWEEETDIARIYGAEQSFRSVSDGYLALLSLEGDDPWVSQWQDSQVEYIYSRSGGAYVLVVDGVLYWLDGDGNATALCNVK